jgi:hypothetical protein
LHLGEDLLSGLGQTGQYRLLGVDRHVGAVQEDQRPAFAVDLAVHPQTVHLSVVALDTIHPFPFVVAAGAPRLSSLVAAACRSRCPPSFAFPDRLAGAYGTWRNMDRPGSYRPGWVRVTDGGP